MQHFICEKMFTNKLFSDTVEETSIAEDRKASSILKAVSLGNYVVLARRAYLEQAESRSDDFAWAAEVTKAKSNLSMDYRLP